MDDRNIGEDARVAPKLKHSYEGPALAQQIDQTSPDEIQVNMLTERQYKYKPKSKNKTWSFKIKDLGSFKQSLIEVLFRFC